MLRKVMKMISVIIPSSGRIKGLARLLQSLSNQNIQVHWEVIVVANPHSRKRQKCVTEAGGRYFATAQAGANCARNLGIDQARGELLVFFDDDCVLEDPYLLFKHWSMHEEMRSVAAIGGFYSSEGGGALGASYAENQQRWLQAAQFGSNGEAEYLIGGHFSYKRQWLATARFDENLRFGGTETEFFLRMRRAGHRFVLSKDLVVRHEVRMTPWTLARKAFLQGQGFAYRQARGLSYRPDRHWVQGVNGFWQRYYQTFFKMGKTLKEKSNLKLAQLGAPVERRDPN